MVDHDDIQAAISARLDGEVPHIAEDVIDAHIAVCPDCRRFQDQAAQLSRQLSFVDSPSSGMSPPEDLSDRLMAGVEPEWRRHASQRQVGLSVSRILLIVLAAVQVIWAVALISSSGGLAVLSADGEVLDPQAQPERVGLLIESAGLRFSLAMGLIMCAWRPNLIAGFAIVPGTLTAFLLGFTARDVVLGMADARQIALLGVLVLTVLVLVFAWMFHRGVYVREAWKQLGSDPRP